jgi:hypothetical protein
MENEWAPPDHPVFTLVPLEFEHHVRNLYAIQNYPPVSHHTFLLTFRQLRDVFMPDVGRHPLATYVSYHDQDHDREHDLVGILPGQRNLRPGDELGDWEEEREE